MNQVTKDNIIQLVREATNITIKQYCGIEPLGMKPCTVNDIAKDWMSIVLLIGEQIKVSYVVYFSLKDINAIVQNKIPEGAVLQAAHTHYMKEYCNVIGGKAKHLLGINNLDVRISLPLCTRTCKDIYFFRGNEVLEDYWIVETPLGNFTNQLRAQLISGASKLENLKLVADHPEEDIEFL